MRLEPRLCSRRAALLAACSSLVGIGPRPAPAADAPPTYSLKGVPGLSLFTGADAPPPADLGVIGRGASGAKAGRLGFCEKKGCISSFSQTDDESYVPPLAYTPEFSIQASSSYGSLKEQLRAQARAEAAAEALAASGAAAPAEGAADAPPAPPALTPNEGGKSLDEAIGELRRAVRAAGGAIQKDEERYLYAEFADPVTGAVDDVEFLFSRDNPIVGFRSVPRSGSDDKRQRARIRDIRKSLAPAGWKSVGRLIEE